MTYLSVTQLETRRRMLDDELRLESRRAVRPATVRPRRRRLRLAAVRGAAAA